MKIDLTKYGQYKNDIFNKLNIDLEPRKKMLDVGCGDGLDSTIFINELDLDTYGIDIYRDKNIDKVKNLNFKEASIYNIPFPDDNFDYIFLHDVLHHIDEETQSNVNHVKALSELKRILKKGGILIILEGNRYNPLFYPHMVKIMGHNHWRQKYFIKTINNVFSDKTCSVNFDFFEAHLYPRNFIWFWKFYESLMEKFSPKSFLAYNVAFVKKTD